MCKHLARFKSPAQEAIELHLCKCRSMRQFKQLHAHLLLHGLHSDTLAVGKLIAFCSVSGYGDLQYARLLFDRVPEPNCFMWNSLIRGYSSSNHSETLALHRLMLCSGITPNGFTLPFVLKSCAAKSALDASQMVHSLVFKLGLQSNVFVMNAVLHAYAACGLVDFAHRVFDEIPERSLVSWNSVIDGYSRVGDLHKAFELLKSMRELGLEPDGFTLVSLLSVCSQMENLGFGRLVHQNIEVTGTDVHLILGNALLDMYGKCGQLRTARTCFDRMPVRNVVSWTSMMCAYAKQGLIDVAKWFFDQMPEKSVISWNAMLACYVQCGCYREGLLFYERMRASGLLLDEAALVTALSACSHIGDLVIGKQIHDYVDENVRNPSMPLYNSILDIYAKCGSLDIALDLFDSMSGKNVVSWNVMIGALAMHGQATKAVELFRNMVAEGLQPDGITFTGLLSACSHGGLLELGKSYFEAMNHVYKVKHEIQHYACMVDLLGRGGHIATAVELIRCMPMKPDVVIWGALLGACRIHGNVWFGDQVMKHVLEAEQCSGGPFVLMSNIYCESQRWEDMKRVRKHMKDKGIRKDSATSLIEINGIVNEFLVEDMRHEKAGDIYLSLNQLMHHLMSPRCSIELAPAILSVD